MKPDQVQRAIAAKESLVAAAQVLWNSRFEILVQLGRVDEALTHIQGSVEEGCNNCDCNNCGGNPGTGCGAHTPGGGEFSNPGILTARGPG